MKKVLYPFALILSLILLNACGAARTNSAAVHPFEKDRYLGKWYEIARLDFSFEKNLNNTTAEYSVNKNGSLRVDNQGYDTLKKKWTQAIGKAKFVGSDTIAQLKVSFFGPFYGGYNVIALEDTYTAALVAGKGLKYLWILSRDKQISEETKNKFLQIAQGMGFKTADLVWVEHNK